MAKPENAKTDFDVLIVGAGFAGLLMLYRLRGMEFSAHIFDDGGDVGGTWYWNRYPGARCDTESMQYSYQFSDALQQEWEWSERYAAQPEILRYVNHVVERFDLRRDITFDTRIQSAVFDEACGRWNIETDKGDSVSATFCVMATGCLSSPFIPDIEGLDDFAGPAHHTGRWPHEGVDYAGRRVGVIGAGSSAIQTVTTIAKEVAHLFVFQRTPHYAVPAHNGPVDKNYERKSKENYAEVRRKAKQLPAGFLQEYNDKAALEVTPEERLQEYEKRWAHGGLPFMGAFTDLNFSKEANQTAAEFVRNKIRKIVKDPETAELLCPDTIIGCRRLCVDTGYYETFNLPYVSLVDISKSGIEKIVPKGIMANGKLYKVDLIVLATGFDAMTGALLKIDIRGRAGRALKEKWAEGPRTNLGLMTAGFPNLFMITGPGNPSVLTNMHTTIHHDVEWIAECLGYLREHGMGQIEPTLEAENAWVAHNNEVAEATLRYECSSWYLGANVPGKPRIFMPYVGGYHVYAAKCEQVAAAGYEGFALTASPG